jgi:hypothetical protein
MKGTYIFRQNGVELGRCENVITTAGKTQIAKSIANQNSQWAGSIAIGSGASAASVTNKKLNFEYARGPVNSISSAPLVVGDVGFASTTVASGSNNVDISTFAGSGTLNVVSTTGFDSCGTISVYATPSVGAPKFYSITYTGKSSTTFTGCNSSNASAIMSTGNQVSIEKIRLTAKAALGENISGQIYEIGIFSSTSLTSQFETILSNCDDIEGWYYQKTDGTWAELIDVSGYSTTVGRAGNQSIYFNSVPTYSSGRRVRFFANFDFSEVSSIDTFAFAVQKTGGSAGNITVRFYTDETNYFTASLSTIASGTNTYTILESAKSSWTTVGSPDWSNITFIEVNNPEGNIYLDGIRLDNVVAETQSILVSRSLPSTIITKVEGTPLEIEYLLDLF